MSDPETKAAAGEFPELWKNLSKINKTPGTTVSPCCNDLQSPRNQGDSRCFGFLNGDSSGDVEASQDIFWDSTSPTQAALVNRNTRVEISDIANRIAPENVKPKEEESSLLQWIDDGSVLYTPEIQKPRGRKRSSRQSSVEDLMKLARQFDQNMQRDVETSEQQSTVNNNLCESVNISETKLTNAAFSVDVKDLKHPSPSDRAEAELHALFDCSTQGVSGRLSEDSVCSQEIKERQGTSALAERQHTELKCHLAAAPEKTHDTCRNTTYNCDDFDDDWENDDLLNDSFVLAVTQNPDAHLNEALKTTFRSENKANTTQLTSVFKQSTSTGTPLQVTDSHGKTSCSSLQELCPKPKTTNRSTFKLAPNPYFHPKMTEEVSKPSFTVVQPKSKMAATTKTCSESQGHKEARNQAGSCLKSPSVKDISDSLWNDGDDDALLYQVCDSVERISNSQPRQATPKSSRGNRDFDAGRQQPVDVAWSTDSTASAKRQPSCTFVRSNSLPETSCETGNYKGWNIPMKGSNNKSRMSQSFPGNRVDPSTLGQCRDSSGKVQAGNSKAHTVMASAPQKSNFSALKRNLSDSAIISNKVFVTSQKTGKCSAEEIERKKQEALARRRLRMQNASKPS